MKTLFTFIKVASLMALLIFTTQLSFGQNYFAYKSKPMVIKPADVTFSAYRWVLLTSPAADGRTQVVLNPSAETVPDLALTLIHPGTYTLRLSVKNTNGCWSEDTDKDISIFVLPDFTVAITATSTTYCENADPKPTLTAAATVDPLFPLPAGVTVELAAWYKTDSSTGDISGKTAVQTTGSTYLLTETGLGQHFYTATGKYVVDAGKLLTDASDPVKSGNVITTTVQAKPTTPSIAPVAKN